MGKVIRLVVVGGPGVGKTTMLERLIHNNYHPDKKFYPTKEDIYMANIDVKNRKETVRIHDTSGIESFGIFWNYFEIFLKVPNGSKRPRHRGTCVTMATGSS